MIPCSKVCGLHFAYSGFFLLTLPNCNMFNGSCLCVAILIEQNRACAYVRDRSSWASIRSQSVVSLSMLHVKQGAGLMSSNSAFFGLFSPPAHALSCRALKDLAQCHDAAICESTVLIYHAQQRISLSCSGHGLLRVLQYLCFSKEERACMNAPTVLRCGLMVSGWW